MRGERVKVGESRTLARERGIRARAWSGKGGLHRERRSNVVVVRIERMVIGLLLPFKGALTNLIAKSTYKQVVNFQLIFFAELTSCVLSSIER